MTIHINGKPYDLESGITIADLLARYQEQLALPAHFALALNQGFVGKADYQTTQVKTGDSLDIFSPIQGG